jgi:O-antigen/teichoic acid export membrane protein
LRAGRLLSAVVIPIGVGLAAVADELVPTLYGDQWSSMIPVLHVLGLSAAVKAATAVASSIFSARNRVGLALTHNAIGLTVLLAGVVVALPYGVEWVAVAVLASSAYSLVPFRVGLGLIGMGTRDAMRILGCPTAAALVMWSSIEAARMWAHYLPHSKATLLLVHISLGALTYCLTLHLLSREYLREFRSLAKTALDKPPV